MTTITKEWLQQTIAEFENTRDDIPFGLDDDDAKILLVLKRALASLDAEPVRYLNKFSGTCVTLEQQSNAADDVAVYIPLYTAPPAPVVPEYVWKTYQKCLGENSLQERVVKKLIGLVWLAGQEIAATRNNETYKDYAGAALARMVSVDRSTWLRVYSGHWAGLKAAFTQLDESALAMALEYYEDEEAFKVAKM
ncbi:bacteriophage antitermination protein Q [Salmonella sp. 32070601201500089SM]|uniref:bacteriophage antitermination protein Q n=1 Tax=Salmonella sp. 32070601201500089SM TaxID=2819686 RepID=UPI0013297C0E|nr:bacteriophage antitermination protein Q [Salmonella sp. 32070601201500089SM]ECW3354239.1 hypothetical protein [Salmonella enterica subsp. enterica serovar Lagos]